MKYFFVLGSNPALSAAELTMVFNLESPMLAGSNFLVAFLKAEINPETAIKRLGGTVKIGRIIKEVPANITTDALCSELIALAAHKQAAASAGKFNFGISVYGDKEFNKQDLGLKLKKYFSGQGRSSRFVVSQEKTLSSVVIEQNKLLRRGIEIVLATIGESLFIGETKAVQPFKDLSRRDYGRPARDDESGMLPPKLAQIMINLTQVQNLEDLIIDPFCGSGTILTEAMLLGYKNILGSDLSQKAITDSKKNVSWIKELYGLTDIKLKFLAKNVLALDKFIKPSSVAAIITEPYLGPQRGRIDFEIVHQELEKLYSGALRNFARVLTSKGRVVMVWPAFYSHRRINPDVGSFKIVSLLPENLRQEKSWQKFLTARGTILYGRSGQKVFREIVVLDK